MNEKHSNQLKRQNPDLHGLYMTLARVLDEFNLEFNQFTKTLRKYYVQEAYTNCQTVARTSLKCGVDRRFVSEIINNKGKQFTPSALHQILKRIERIAKSNNMIVNKLGKKSIQSIMLKLAPGATTINSIVEQLIAQGCIEDLDQSIRFINNNFSNSGNIKLQQLSVKLNEYTDALIRELQEA